MPRIRDTAGNYIDVGEVVNEPGSGGVTVDNQSDPPAEVTTLVAPGATLSGDEADFSTALAIRSSTTTLTDAQIKALPTTAVELVPAPGAGSLIYPLGAVLRLDWTADYTNIDGGCKLAVTQATSDANNPAFLTALHEENLGIGGLMALGDDAFAFVGPRMLSGAESAFVQGVAGYNTFDVENVALYLRATNGAAGAFTGGDPANILKVTVVYAVLAA